MHHMLELTNEEIVRAEDEPEGVDSANYSAHVR